MEMAFRCAVRFGKSSDVFILMLTARDTELDEVKALEMGVDDYMSKPFSIAVLKARIKKLLSRKSRKTVDQLQWNPSGQKQLSGDLQRRSAGAE